MSLQKEGPSPRNQGPPSQVLVSWEREDPKFGTRRRGSPLGSVPDPLPYTHSPLWPRQLRGCCLQEGPVPFPVPQSPEHSRVSLRVKWGKKERPAREGAEKGHTAHESPGSNLTPPGLHRSHSLRGSKPSPAPPSSLCPKVPVSSPCQSARVCVSVCSYASPPALQRRQPGGLAGPGRDGVSALVPGPHVPHAQRRGPAGRLGGRFLEAPPAGEWCGVGGWVLLLPGPAPLNSGQVSFLTGSLSTCRASLGPFLGHPSSGS